MIAEQMFKALVAYTTWNSPEVEDAQNLYKMQKLLPRVPVSAYVCSYWQPNADLHQMVADMIALEKSMLEQPTPPYISHDDLINNVGYLQDEYRDFGLEYPQARLEEMVTTTHRDATPEAIVVEIYRRQTVPQPKAQLP